MASQRASEVPAKLSTNSSVVSKRPDGSDSYSNNKLSVMHGGHQSTGMNETIYLPKIGENRSSLCIYHYQGSSAHGVGEGSAYGSGEGKYYNQNSKQNSSSGPSSPSGFNGPSSNKDLLIGILCSNRFCRSYLIRLMKVTRSYYYGRNRRLSSCAYFIRLILCVFAFFITLILFY